MCRNRCTMVAMTDMYIDMYQERLMTDERMNDERTVDGGPDAAEARQALSRRALLAGGAGVAGLVAGAGLVGRGGVAAAASSAVREKLGGPQDMFMQFNLPSKTLPVVGESQDSVYSKWIQVADFSLEVENPTTIGSSTGGAGAGKLKFDQFSVSKGVDNATPQLYQAMAMGIHFDLVRIAFRKAGAGIANKRALIFFDFGLVYVRDMDWSSSSESMGEKVTFVFGEMQIKYQIQKPDGSGGTPNIFGWDQTKNGPWTSPNVPTP